METSTVAGPELISVAARNALRTLIANTVPPRDIDAIWQREGFPLPFEDAQVPGQSGLTFSARRFQAYIDQINWSDKDQVERAVDAFENAIAVAWDAWPFNEDRIVEVAQLRLALENDGYHLSNEGTIRPIATGAVSLNVLTQWPLKSDQLVLLHVLYRIVANPNWGPAMSWPNWNYVKSQARAAGMTSHRADEAISTLPYSNVGTLTPYSLVWRSQTKGGPVQPSETIGLTMAGLVRVDAAAADCLARLAQTAAQKEAELPVEPHRIPAGAWALTDAIPSFLSQSSRPTMNTPTAADLLRHEPTPLAGDTQGFALTYEVKLGDGHLASFLEVASATDYFQALDVSVQALRPQLVAGRETIGLMTAPIETPQAPPAPDRRSVFLVHGRNQAAKNAMTDFLRALDLSVISWTKANTLARQTHNHNPSTLETVQAGLRAAAAVVVLFTPDDLVVLDPRLESGGVELSGQARPNVILEAGMIIGMDDAKALSVQLGKQRAITDIAGINFVNIGDDMDKKEDLADRLLGMGLHGEKHWRRMDSIKFDETLDYLSEPPPFAQ